MSIITYKLNNNIDKKIPTGGNIFAVNNVN